MNSNRKIYHSNCENCQYGGGQCAAMDKLSRCKSYDPVNEELYVDELMEYLRGHIDPSIHKKLNRTISKSSSDITYDDGSGTLDHYYVGMINDALKEIRHGLTAYVFSESQIAELVRFEPDIEVELNDGIFYVSL